MNHLKLRTLLITTLALGTAQASLAAGGMTFEPPSGRNGWQPATAKALPQTAVVRAPAGGGSVYEPPSGRNGWHATTAKSLPLSATAKTGLRSANGR